MMNCRSNGWPDDSSALAPRTSLKDERPMHMLLQLQLTATQAPGAHEVYPRRGQARGGQEQDDGDGRHVAATSPQARHRPRSSAWTRDTCPHPLASAGRGMVSSSGHITSGSENSEPGMRCHLRQYSSHSCPAGYSENRHGALAMGRLMMTPMSCSLAARLYFFRMICLLNGIKTQLFQEIKKRQPGLTLFYFCQSCFFIYGKQTFYWSMLNIIRS